MESKFKEGNLVMKKLFIALIIAPVFSVTSNAFAASSNTDSVNSNLSPSHRILSKTYLIHRRYTIQNMANTASKNNFQSTILSKISLFHPESYTQKSSMNVVSYSIQPSVLSKRILFSHAEKMGMMDQLNS